VRRRPSRRWGRWALLAACGLFWYLAWVYLTLPDVRVLATAPPAETAFMRVRAREARRAARIPVRRYQFVPYARISGHLKRAVIVAEDSAFWQHEGIDVEAIKDSIEVNLERMEFARGASTITQQLAKNLYLSPSKNPVRKLRELMITRKLEAALPKRRILELYLNVVEWGDGVYGAEAAARVHFRTSAAALSAPQSALLAGALVNPRVLDPSHPPGRLLRRQRMILRRMGRAAPPPDAAPPAAAPLAAEPPAPLAVEPAPPGAAPPVEPDATPPPAVEPPAAVPDPAAPPPAADRSALRSPRRGRRVA
jgi:monofunctional biosynthetic peptidoglycan transglycosylase